MKFGDVRTEAQIQADVVKHCRSMEKADPRYKLLFAIPNGGYRGRAQRQGAGFSAGVPDLFLAWSASYRVEAGESLGHIFYHGLFIEMKTPKGVVSAAQKAWHSRLTEAGYRVEVCRSAQEAIDLIKSYLGG